MTAPVSRPGWVTLLPVDPDDQAGAAFLGRYPRGAVVRLAHVDGVVLAHALEQDSDSDTPPVPAVMVHVTEPPIDGVVLRIWRESQIVDSPLTEGDKAALRQQALAIPTPPAVMALLAGWGAEASPGTSGVAIAGRTDWEENPGIKTYPLKEEDLAENPDLPPVTIGQTVNTNIGFEMCRSGIVEGFGPRHVEVRDIDGVIGTHAVWKRSDLIWPGADSIVGSDDDVPVGDEPIRTIPASVLAYVSDESLCEIRRAAADGCFGSHGYDEIDAAFRRREQGAINEALLPRATEAMRLRRALFHYCGLYAEARDADDADRVADPGCR